MSTLVRLFVESPLGLGALITPALSQSHYLTSVMRLNAGDAVELFNGVDGAWLARLTTVTKKSCTLVCQAQTRAQEQPQDLWLCAAPLKKGRIDWVAEKACELGVANFMPVLTKRSVVDRLNLERLRAHMVEAAEQCGRTSLPALHPIQNLDSLLKNWPKERQLLFFDEEGGLPAYPALQTINTRACAILIGPEGGFDAVERSLLIGHNSSLRLSLGPRILRADTAAVAAMSLWQALKGDWQTASNNA